MHKKKDRHFAFHIGIHLFSVLVVFAVALLVGYSSKHQGVDFRGFLAQTLSGELSSTTAYKEVSFTVIPGLMAECDLVIPRTPVLFSVVGDSVGGSFRLSADTLGERTVTPGEHIFPNGTYHWSAILNSGYVGSGALSGDFVLNNPCPQTPGTIEANISPTTTAGTVNPVTSGTTDATASLSPVLNTTIVPGVWYAGTKRESGATLPGAPTLRIFIPDALHVAFQLGGVNSSAQSFTEQNGVTRISGTDAWLIDLTSAKIPDGGYKVMAYYETSSGKYFTEGIYFTIKRPEIAPLSIAPVSETTVTSPVTLIASSPIATTTIIAPLTPKPVLKIFISDIPVTDLSHAFSDGEVELRVETPSAKRVTLFAASSSSNVFELGGAVKDDLLSMQKDVWSFVWNIENVKAGLYKVYARVVTADNRFVETNMVMMNITREPPIKELVVASEGAKGGASATSGTMSASEIDEVFARVTAPELCVNREECQLYCSHHPEEKERCASFARIVLERATKVLPSLTDGIDPLRLQIILDDQKRSREIPEEVATPEHLRDFCAESSHADVCMKVLMRNDLASEEALETKRELVAQVQKEERRIFAERIGARVFVDNDMDGITDYDEVNIYHTDPNDQDTDHDGFPDGAEIMAHTNPLGGKNVESGTTSENILRDEFVRMENPRLSGSMSPDLLAVEDVAMIEDASLPQDGFASSSKLSFRGHATPNSFVTLYIFSDPIMVTIKADESGAWTYTLDKALADGSHEIYSAITDSGGHILAKSEPLPFVKEASAVSVGSAALLPGNTEPGFFSGASLYAFIAIIIGVLGFAFSIIGFMVRRRDVESLPLEQGE